MTRVLTVVIDPDEDLVDRLISMEWWARETAWPDGLEEEVILDRAAELLGDLAMTLHAAQETALMLYAPDGQFELGSIAVVDADVPGKSAAVESARLAVPHDPLPDGSARVPRLLDRCAAWSRSDFGAVLAAAVLGAPIRSDRLSVCLDLRQLRSYQRFVQRVLDDPLDRFIFLGLNPGPGYAAGPSRNEHAPATQPPAATSGLDKTPPGIDI